MTVRARHSLRQRPVRHEPVWLTSEGDDMSTSNPLKCVALAGVFLALACPAAALQFATTTGGNEHSEPSRLNAKTYASETVTSVKSVSVADNPNSAPFYVFGETVVSGGGPEPHGYTSVPIDETVLIDHEDAATAAGQDSLSNAIFNLHCDAVSIGALAFNVPWGLAWCRLFDELWLLEEHIQDPLTYAIQQVLEMMQPEWVYRGYRHAEDVVVTATFRPVSTGGGGIIGYSMSIWGGIHDSQFCGMDGCHCDEMSPCFDGTDCWWEGGAVGTCRAFPIFD